MAKRNRKYVVAVIFKSQLEDLNKFFKETEVDNMTFGRFPLLTNNQISFDVCNFKGEE